MHRLGSVLTAFAPLVLIAACTTFDGAVADQGSHESGLTTFRALPMKG